MNKGKIILSAAAFIVTAASTVAFKAASSFNNKPRVFVATSNGAGCFTCKSVWSKSNGVRLASCVTRSGGKLAARNGKTYFTAKTAGQGCTHAVTKVTVIN